MRAFLFLWHMYKPDLITRAKVAWHIFQKGIPSPRPIGRKAAGPYVWPAWREGTPQWHTTDFGSFVEEGFNLNSLIYSAIMYKARSKMSAPLRAYTGDPQSPDILPADHPLTRLVARPNPYQSGVEFQALNEVYFNLGNSFILFKRPLKGGLPERMYGLRPDRVFIIPGDGKLKGYLYVPEGKSFYDGIPVLPEDMMHVKLPNPGDPLEGMGYGMAPTSIGQSTDVDNEVTRFLKLFFQNGAMLMGVLKFSIPLDDDVVAAVKWRWMEMYGGGVDNWTGIGVLDQGGEYQRLGATFDEMGFEALDERNESRILGPLGVPPILIGSRVGLLRSTYSNYAEARRAYWDDTAIPEQTLFETNYQYYLVEDDAFVKFDRSRVPALQKDIPKLSGAAYTMWKMGVPANQAFRSVGLDVGDVPGGDIGYLPAGVLPAGALPAETEQTNEGAIEAEEDERKNRRRHWGRKQQAETFIPLGADQPLPALPGAVSVEEADIDEAVAAWNEVMPEAAGMLEAE